MDFATSVLQCRSVNTSEIAAGLPRAVKNDDSRYRVINKACEGGKTAVLMLDQSKVSGMPYGMRWGIEALFCDFKSRGFGITNTHLSHAERIARLILVLAIALFFAVSTAMQPDKNLSKYTPKKPIVA